MIRRRSSVFIAAWFVLQGCHTERSAAPPPRTASPTPQQPYPPPAAAQPLPPTAPPSVPPSAAAPNVAQYRDQQWLRSQATGVLGELIAVLPQGHVARVQGLPLLFDPTPGAVNAFAACTRQGAVLAITDGMLEISAYLAQAYAHDQLFGTQKVDEYIAFLARTQRPNEPLQSPDPNFFDATQANDPRRSALAFQSLGELLAFVLGHELAHHYLGHLPCTGGAGMLGTGELGRVLSSVVPVFNQPNELAADAAGMNNVLVAGASRADYRWTEAGGLLTMRFFAGLDRMTAIDVLFGFERTHPPPGLRVPVIQQTANAWRWTGGGWLPIPRLGWAEFSKQPSAQAATRPRRIDRG